MLKPLLGPCDSYQLEPFAYPWAWEMSRAQEWQNVVLTYHDRKYRVLCNDLLGCVEEMQEEL